MPPRSLLGYHTAMVHPDGPVLPSASGRTPTLNGPRSGLHTAIALAFAGCAVLHVLLSRLSWLGIPLQTDTGMWAYLGGRILDGALPYRDLWESKPPGIYYTFALVEWLSGIGRDGPLFWLD